MIYNAVKFLFAEQMIMPLEESSNFGSHKKLTVNMLYLRINEQTGAEERIGHYEVKKEEFAPDFAHQIAEHTCTHINM